MARFRVFDTETANQLIPRITTADSIDLCTTGEYFSAEAGEVILAPSLKSGDVLYIKIRSASAVTAPQPAPVQPAPQPFPEQPVIASTPPASTPATPNSKSYVATGFLGLDGELEEEVPEAPKPWWKRLID